MTNIERADKWYEIVERLNAIYYRQGTPFEKQLLVMHYLVFATEMWLSYWRKILLKNSTRLMEGRQPSETL